MTVRSKFSDSHNGIENDMVYHVGQRLSLKLNQSCTVRYIGPVEGKPGEWLGVEWDDPNRGKHNGAHDGKTYFQCRSNSLTAGSFLKPKQSLDPTRTFLQALREKYMTKDDGTVSEAVYFSSKQAEEVGFEKFARRQAQLQGIHVVVLDRMRIIADDIENDKTEISEACAHITELDLSSNLFETVGEVISICVLLPKLQRLILDGNRFNMEGIDQEYLTQRLPGVKSIGLSNTLLSWSELSSIVSIFPKTTHLTFADNVLTNIPTQQLSTSLEVLDLSGNLIPSFSALGGLSHCTSLKTLILKQNLIEDVVSNSDPDVQDISFGRHIQDLDMAYNRISSWSILNAIPRVFPHAKHVRITGNPLYTGLRSAEGKILTGEDGHMLTIARLPQLETLNYSKITEKERLNAETYYLGQVAVELSLAGVESESSILSQHPRWKALCEEYGEPAVLRKQTHDRIDPNSLAARLVTVAFSLHPGVSPGVASRGWLDQIPKSISIYALLGIVGKRLGIMPLRLRLVWETGERDPVGLDRGYTGPEWWDSSDDESEANVASGDTMLREVELVAGTRAVGTYIEEREASIRIEMRNAPSVVDGQSL